MKKSYLILLFFTISFGVFAQIPDWAINLPKSKNSTFEYVVGVGEGYNYKNAYNEAICDMLRKTLFRYGISVESNAIIEAASQGKSLTTISDEYHLPPMREVCTSQIKQQGVERVYVLFQVPPAGYINNPTFEPFKCDKEIKAKKDYIGLNTFSGGYPWNVIFGLEIKRLWFGAYLDLGLDFIPIDVDITYDFYDGYKYKQSREHYYADGTKISFHYALGIKFYLYKGLFVGLGYETIANKQSVDIQCTEGQKSDDYYLDDKLIYSGITPSQITIDDEADIFWGNLKKYIDPKGLSIHIGYDFSNPNVAGCNISVGAVRVNNEFIPCAALKWGVVWPLKKN